MPKVRVHNFTLSLDGYAAGPDQSLQDPIGVGGHRLHEWLFATRTFRQTFDTEGGENGPGSRPSGFAPAALKCSRPRSNSLSQQIFHSA